MQFKIDQTEKENNERINSYPMVSQSISEIEKQND